jgi:hypothetical protein
MRQYMKLNYEILERVNKFTYLGYSISYPSSNDVEFKLVKFLQLISTVKGIIFKKVETVLKLCNTLILPIFLYG